MAMTVLPRDPIALTISESAKWYIDYHIRPYFLGDQVLVVLGHYNDEMDAEFYLTFYDENQKDLRLGNVMLNRMTLVCRRMTDDFPYYEVVTEHEAMAAGWAGWRLINDDGSEVPDPESPEDVELDLVADALEAGGNFRL